MKNIFFETVFETEINKSVLYVYGYEPYFGKHIKIGKCVDNVVTPSHGYFYPHKYGKFLKKYAKQIGK